ncbi:MAG TPA: asparagine synthase (glutamine-hydrolyzing), partial [Chloroflexota bacterium]
CGIAGILRWDGQPIAAQTIGGMTSILAHRGPDDEGLWTEGPVGLGNRRLAIIDLSPAAHQPMASAGGEAVIVYNGELYNYQALRLELEAAGRQFHSRSDTEVVLQAYLEWGEDCLQRFNGHLAFAIWDRRLKRLFLARDRFGVKPLYYLYDGSKLLFGSEIKAILAHPEVRASVSPAAMNEYFVFQNVLSDLTLFEGVHLLPAGCWLSADLERPAEPRQRRYWDFRVASALPNISREEAVEELQRLFDQAVTRQLMSDVPVGCYLSGGMDSGSITAVARRQLGRLTTFTLGFDLSSASGLELAFDERANSEMLSNLLKTEHYEMVLHAGDMEAVMPELIWHLEDPRVGQCYPNYYVARLAGKFVKVVLSGAGGDELFAGYPWRYYRGLNSRGSHDFYANYYDFWQRLVPDADKAALFQPSVYPDIKDLSPFDTFKSVIEGADLPLESNQDFVNASLYFELKTFLHGLLLVEDKVSMAHSLETRAPFLDNDLAEFALRLPVEYRLGNVDQPPRAVDEDQAGKRIRYELQSGDGKLILREMMRRVIPAEITQRVKQGFSAPDASWFRGESIDYVNGLLRDPRARIYDYLQPEYVTGVLDQHTSGQANKRLLIWSLLSFEWWCRTFLDASVARRPGPVQRPFEACA